MSIFVGNLPFRAEQEDVAELFAPFGEVANCALPLERDTGRKRGFAFVELAEQRSNVENAQVLVEDTGSTLRFLHRVVNGGANRSYGIEAARLAGVPAPVVLRARQVLSRIEANSHVSVQADAA